MEEILSTKPVSPTRTKRIGTGKGVVIGNGKGVSSSKVLKHQGGRAGSASCSASSSAG